MSDWIDNRGRNLDRHGSGNRGANRHIGRRGPHTRSRTMREDSPPLSCGSAPPDERRALRYLWQAWSGGKSRKQEQDQHAQRFVEMGEQGFQSLHLDAIIINPHEKLFQMELNHGTQQQLQNETMHRASCVGMNDSLNKVNQVFNGGNNVGGMEGSQTRIMSMQPNPKDLQGSGSLEGLSLQAYQSLVIVITPQEQILPPTIFMTQLDT
jgi:hypothetical protein